MKLQVEMEFGDATTYDKCPDGFLIFKGRLAAKTLHGVFYGDGTIPFLALPEDTAIPITKISTLVQKEKNEPAQMGSAGVEGPDSNFSERGPAGAVGHQDDPGPKGIMGWTPAPPTPEQVPVHVRASDYPKEPPTLFSISKQIEDLKGMVENLTYVKEPPQPHVCGCQSGEACLLAENKDDAVGKLAKQTVQSMTALDNHIARLYDHIRKLEEKFDGRRSISAAGT